MLLQFHLSINSHLPSKVFLRGGIQNKPRSPFLFWLHNSLRGGIPLGLIYRYLALEIYFGVRSSSLLCLCCLPYSAGLWTKYVLVSFLPSHWHSECGPYDVSFCQKRGGRGNEGEKERIRNVDIRELRRKGLGIRGDNNCIVHGNPTTRPSFFFGVWKASRKTSQKSILQKFLRNFSGSSGLHLYQLSNLSITFGFVAHVCSKTTRHIRRWEGGPQTHTSPIYHGPWGAQTRGQRWHRAREFNRESRQYRGSPL